VKKKDSLSFPISTQNPVLAKRLQDVGVSTVMPLGSPSGQIVGLQTRDQIRIIIEQATVPCGRGMQDSARRVTPAEAMEWGADAVLVNTALAIASDPNRIAIAFKMAVEAGRASGTKSGLARLRRQRTRQVRSPHFSITDISAKGENHHMKQLKPARVRQLLATPASSAFWWWEIVDARPFIWGNVSRISPGGASARGGFRA